jgi:hypothetical protein
VCAWMLNDESSSASSTHRDAGEVLDAEGV